MGSIGFAIVVRSPTGRRANAGPRVRRTIINLTSPRLSSTFHSQKGPPPPPPQPARWRTFRYDRAAAAVTVRPALVSIPRGQISRTPPRPPAMPPRLLPWPILSLTPSVSENNFRKRRRTKRAAVAGRVQRRRIGGWRRKSHRAGGTFPDTKSPSHREGTPTPKRCPRCDARRKGILRVRSDPRKLCLQKTTDGRQLRFSGRPG